MGFNAGYKYKGLRSHFEKKNCKYMIVYKMIFCHGNRDYHIAVESAHTILCKDSWTIFQLTISKNDKWQNN